MLDIIIPIFNERCNLANVLDNIKNQKFDLTKITIYLIDDNSNDTYEDILDLYNYLNIKYFKLNKNVGSGLARKYGLNKSNGDYIIFMDADDCFYDNNSISNLYNTINNKYDYVAGITYYEKSNIFKINSGDLHGKIYSRLFLLKNSINFNNTRFHEDNAFNSLVLLCNPKRKEINYIVYHYKDNKKSITSVSNKIEFQRMEIYISNMKYVITEAKKRNIDNKQIKQYILNKIRYLYVLYNNYYSIDEKKIFEFWLKKYNIDILEFLNIKDYNILEKELSSKSVFF